MTSRTSRLQIDARATFPLVGLQQALESALRLYAAEQNTRPVDEPTFRRLLGHDRQSGQLVRLAMSMSLYGLINRRKNTYALSEGALRLFSSADQGEFRALVYDAALLPQGVRELADTSSARLDSRELEGDLRGRGVAETDRALILEVLRENGEFVHQEQRLGELFGRVQALRAEQPDPRVLGWIQGRARWMNTQAGRTANLALVVVMFVGSLMYVAFSALSPERLSSTAARQSAAPTSTDTASTGTGSTAPARTPGPRVTRPAVNGAAPPRNAVDAPFPPRRLAASSASRSRAGRRAPSASARRPCVTTYQFSKLETFTVVVIDREDRLRS